MLLCFIPSIKPTQKWKAWKAISRNLIKLPYIPKPNWNYFSHFYFPVNLRADGGYYGLTPTSPVANPLLFWMQLNISWRSCVMFLGRKGDVALKQTDWGYKSSQNLPGCSQCNWIRTASAVWILTHSIESNPIADRLTRISQAILIWHGE